MSQVVDLDALLTSETYLRDPHPINHQLRYTDPMHRSESLGAWVPTRYRDVRSLLTEWDRFSSRDTNRPRFERVLANLPPNERMEQLDFWAFGGLFQSDPPEYRKFRSATMHALLPRLDRMPGRVQGLVDAMIDAFIERGQVDLVAEFSFDLPAIVILELLGVPPDDRPAIRRWADALTKAHSDPTGGAAREGTLSLREAREWLRGIVAEKTSRPTDDIISDLVHSPEYSTMEERDVLSTIVFLLVAGHETTANLISSAMALLADDATLRANLLDGPERIPWVLEEVLRLESPIQTTARVAKEDTELGGALVRKGEVVLVMHGAANHDPEQFPDPDGFFPDRDASSHVAFGHGVHFCVGAPLARIEGPIAVHTLLRRLEKLERAGDAPWQANFSFRGREQLPLAFAPGPRIGDGQS